MLEAPPNPHRKVSQDEFLIWLKGFLACRETLSEAHLRHLKDELARVKKSDPAPTFDPTWVQPLWQSPPYNVGSPSCGIAYCGAAK